MNCDELASREPLQFNICDFTLGEIADVKLFHVNTTTPRWDLLLPVTATLIGSLMVALALLSVFAFRQRDTLALDGRIFGLAHEAELRLRETGRDAASDILEDILEDGRPEVLGLRLADPAGATLATAGSEATELNRRSVDVFVGPGLRGGPGPGGPPTDFAMRGPGWRSGGRGRLVLDLLLDPVAESPPVVVRLLIPAAVTVALGLISLAVLGGRLLVRQRLEAQREAQRRRLEALARAGAGLAHQLRTPLATIKGSCQLIGEQLGQSPLAARLETSVEQADRMERMLGMLLDFARPPTPQVEAVALAPLLNELAARRPTLKLTPVEDITVNADPEHLAQILDNLADNAEAFSPDGEFVEVTTLSHHGEVRVIVADRGPGPGPDPEEPFQPYFTTRADGTGLGLAIARNLAEANNGSLMLRLRSGGGCEAILILEPAGVAS